MHNQKAFSDIVLCNLEAEREFVRNKTELEGGKLEDINGQLFWQLPGAPYITTTYGCVALGQLLDPPTSPTSGSLHASWEINNFLAHLQRADKIQVVWQK